MAKNKFQVVVEWKDGKVERYPYETRKAAEDNINYHRSEAEKVGPVNQIYITGR